MQRRILFTLLGLLLFAIPSRAQEKVDDELAFVQQLRDRNMPDLALEYLEKRLGKNPKYAADLPLEIAQTRLVLAKKDTDPNNRITQYNLIRTELQDFVAKNPAHPRVTAAKLQVAQVSAEQGKAQLVRSLAMPEDDSGRKDELTKAHQLLGSAIKDFEILAEQLKTDEAKNRSAFERGVLLTSQGKAFLELKLDKQAGDAFKAAMLLFDKLTEDLANRDPLKPLCFAWVGRAYSLNAQPDKANPKFTEARNTGDRDGKRLAEYFEMLQSYEKEGNLTEADRAKILREATAWYSTYTGYRNSPEGQGVQYVLAKMLFEAGAKTSGAPRKTVWDQARGLISNLEKVENDYTELARQLKIDMLSVEGAFTGDPTKLTTFDSVYTRGLYELKELYKNEKKFNTDEAKKKQQEFIADIFKLSLKKAEVVANINQTDFGLANFYLTGVQLTLKRYAEAYQTGKEFAEKHPRNKKASECALYAADALREQINKADDESDATKEARKKLYELGEVMAKNWPKDRAGEFGRYLVYNHLIKEPPQGKTPEEKRADQKAREDKAITIGGDLARFEIASQRARENKFYESVLMLRDIKPAFPRFVIAQSQFGLYALEVQKENEARKKKNDPKDPPLLLPGDKREMRDVALEAFERIPEPPVTDADATRFYLIGKIALGKQLYSQKKYDALVALTAKLLPAVPNIKGEEDKKAFEAGINALRMSADYGRAYDANQAGNHQQVVAILDPLINDIKAGKYPDVKENQALLSGMMGMGLRSNLQISRGTRSKEIFAIWNGIERERIQVKAKQEADKREAGIMELEKKQGLSDDDKKLLDQEKKQLIEDKKLLTEAGLNEALAQHRANVLLQTFGEMRKQIDKLRKAGDKAKLDATISQVSALLADEKPDGAMKPGQRFLLAQCYHSIGRFEQAAGLLKLFPAPNATPQDLGLWKRAQVLLIDSVRLQSKEAKDAKLFDEALKLLDTIMLPTEDDKKKKQPGWGKRDVNALKEEVQVLMDRNQFLTGQSTWTAAANRCNDLLKVLGPQVQKSDAMREHYLEVGGFFVHAMTKLAEDQKDMMKRERYFTSAANFFIKVNKSFVEAAPDDAVKQRNLGIVKDHYLGFLNSTEGAETKAMMLKLDPELTRVFTEK